MSATLFSLAPERLPAQASASPKDEPEIVVVGTAHFGSLPVDRVPANVMTLEQDEVGMPGIFTPADALNRRFGTISAVDALGNPLQQGITVRGFTAAPVLGEAQGVAVYQGAMRANEAFGDVVQWDTLPVFAIEKIQVVPGSHPAYGLNAIGGTVVLTTKTGFSAPGVAAETVGGSYGRRSGTVEYGAQSGTVGLYAGVNGVSDRGWRDESPGSILRGFADLAWQDAGRELGLSLTFAETNLAGNGPAPADLLALRRQAVFTYPDETRSRLFAGTLRASLDFAGGFELQAGAYGRQLRRGTRNGDQGEFEQCAALVGLVDNFTPPPGSLCFGAEIDEEDGQVEGNPTVLIGSGGSVIGGYDEVPEAVFNRTLTRTSSWGGSAQLAWKSKLGTAENILIIGGTADVSSTRYRSGAELGALGPDRGVESFGVAIGNDEFNVALGSRSRTFGVYASDTLSPRPGLHVTGSVRWNRADLRLRDQIGTALNGDHIFDRADVGVGMAWSAAQSLTVFTSLTKSSRFPTPAELSCADPDRPCRFPNAFLSDPPLEPVKARTVEVGIRRSKGTDPTSPRLSLAAFVTDSVDDIIFISAGPVIGTGYFDNVTATRRLGLEADLRGRTGAVDWYLSYGLVEATYRSSFRVQAPHNPLADQNGEILVESGDRIPGIPLHSVKAGAEVAFSRLSVGMDLAASTRRFLRGDEANLNRPLDPLLVLNTQASYRKGAIELFIRVENLLDTRFETFGLFGDAEELGFGDARFLSPGAPRRAYAGVRVSL